MAFTRTLYTFGTNATTRGTVVALARAKLREKTGDSFDSTDLNSFFLHTYRVWAQELRWPEARWTDTTVADQREYTLPGDVAGIARVYVNGNRIPPTTIPLLEGEVIRAWDETWRRLPSVTLPDATQNLPTGGIPITAGPGFPPKRMVYTVKGGVLILAPPPAAAYPLWVEGYAIPDAPSLDGDPLVFPAHPTFEEGIAAGIAARLLVSEDRPKTAAMLQMEEQEKLDLARKWRRGFQADLQQIVQPYNYRGYWSR